jgi:hypothetical protein
MTAFLLTVEKQAGAPSPAGRVRAARTSDLGFESRRQGEWTDRSGAVHLAWWHGDAPGGVHERDDGIVIVSGDLRRAGQRWGTGEGCASKLMTDASSRSLPALRDDLRGVFASVLVTADGDGWVVADPIGHRCLYYGEDDRRLVVSSRASLAGQALAGGDAPPSRDALGVSWLAFTTYRVGDRSGYEQVRVSTPGQRLRLAGGRPTWEQDDPFHVGPDDRLRSHSIEQLAELVLDDVGEALTTFLDQPAERHLISLTGGKDSRMVLAAALRAGVASAFVFQTVGPPGLLDVQIATALAEELGLRHEVRFLELKATEPFGDRFRRFVESTAGMVSGWDLEAETGTGELRVTGLCGELLRSCEKLPEGFREGDRITEVFAPGRIGRLDLVRPEASSQLRRELLERLATEPRTDADPLDRAQVHFVTSRMRFTRLGAREELSGDRRVHPLYSGQGLRAALSLDSRDRQSELLVGSILQMVSPRLLKGPFTDKGWDPRARRHLGVAEPPPAPEPTRRPMSLVASLFAAHGDERSELLADVLADAGNPAWDVLDRSAALGALARYPSLTIRERQALFGAATALVWLAQ